MSELKPCPLCRAVPTMEPFAGEPATCCETSGCPLEGHAMTVEEWNTLHAPELPEGYRVEVLEDGHLGLLDTKRELVAWLGDVSGCLFLNSVYRITEPKDFPALAAFLQGAR